MMKENSKMKDSGVDWLGQIPEDWEVRKLKWALSALESGGRDYGSEKLTDGAFSVGGEHVGWNGELLLRNPRFVSENFFWKMNNGKIKIDDVLLVKDGATIGKTSLVQEMKFEKMAVNEHVFILRSNKECLPKYLFYFIFSSIGQEQISLEIKGSAQPGLNSQFINKNLIALPPLETQNAIANYLDEKTAQIGKFIADKKKMVGLLKEQKQAIIHQAATKGIDKNAKMKDSDIAWLGQIPEGWELRKLKTICKVNPSAKRNIVSDLEVVFLPMEKVSENWNIFQDLRVKTENLVKGFTYFERGDLIFAKITPCFENGKGALLSNLESDYGFGSTEFHVLRAIIKKVSGNYLKFVVTNDAFKKVGETFMEGAAGQKRVTTEFVKNYLIPTPPLETQNAIVAHIKKETSRINIAIKKIEQEIELAQEYKKSLIFHAVTGKIKIN